MAKAGDKRSPKRGRGKTPSPPEGGGQPAHELPTIKIQPSKEFAEQVRVAGEVIKRIGRRLQQPSTDTARIDRAIAHRAGITAHETGSTPAAPDTPAADQLPPPQPKITAGAWFKKAFIDHPIRLGEQTGDYANRLHP